MKQLCIKRSFLVFILCSAAISAGALDFGLVVDQEVKGSNENGDAAFFYTPLLRPWIEGSLGRNYHLSLSGKIGFEYAEDSWRDPPVLPELDRSELTWFLSPEFYLKAGRQRFTDSSGFTASGLFDGISGHFSLRGGRFSLGAWYTGLLYKDTADIVMTRRDWGEYSKPFSFKGGYFASRRTLVSLDWENPGFSPSSSLALGLLAQFDLNGGADWFHSQYLSAKYGLRLPGGFGLEGTAVLGAGESGKAVLFFLGALDLNWTPPGGPEDRLSLRGVYSSPSWGGRLGSFIPVNSLAQSQVFSSAIKGLSVIKGAYSLRPRRTLSLALELCYVIRTDMVSFEDRRDPDKQKGEGYFLGGEYYAAALWTPLPDLTLTAGGGAFFPGLGNAFTPGTAIRWKALLGLILSL